MPAQARWSTCRLGRSPLPVQAPPGPPCGSPTQRPRRAPPYARKREAGETESGGTREAEGGGLARKGTQAEERGRPRARRPLPWRPGKGRPCSHLDFIPERRAADFRNYQMNSCCLQPPRSWGFVAAAVTHRVASPLLRAPRLHGALPPGPRQQPPPRSPRSAPDPLRSVLCSAAGGTLSPTGLGHAPLRVKASTLGD